MSKTIYEKENPTEEELLTMHWPTEAELPCNEDNFVRNYHESPQSSLITDCLSPLLQQRHPNGDFSVGHDVGIYWRLPREGEVPQRGAICPDWFYVPGVSQMVEGERRMKRSYVMWYEVISPLIVLEFVSGNGSEERDYTPHKGKFWIYEQAVKAVFYGIAEINPTKFELYHLVDGRYQLVQANERGHFPIETLGIEFGIWSGVYRTYHLDWLRVWDLQGNLFPTGDELALEQRQRAEEERQRAEEERQRAEEQRQRAEEERQRAEKAEDQVKILAEKLEKLRAMGIDVDGI